MIDNYISIRYICEKVVDHYNTRTKMIDIRTFRVVIDNDLSKSRFYNIMNVSRKLAYNKKECILIGRIKYIPFNWIASEIT